jgi:hypothetical protein
MRKPADTERPRPGSDQQLNGYVFTIWAAGRRFELTKYAKSERNARDRLGLGFFSHVIGVRRLDKPPSREPNDQWD